ncbi:hypothetical protein [Hyphomonas sp. BRH_c22]|uniref:hypothetical protein n=1 Tax=Hyphomonas sp. BRH_c22 TaxID=1629710 RepID=UPI002608963E|nr:hypothetical protein [Hyphomonas sp. BRH_c22]
MSEHFAVVAQTIREDAIRSSTENVERIVAEFSAGGRLFSGAFWRALERALCQHVREFSRELRARLSEHDVEHTTIDETDFATAKTLVDQFAADVRELHQGQRYRQGDRYPHGHEPFEDGELDSVILDARSSIEADRKVFHSKRSFWKWAWGDARRRMFAGVLFLIGAVASAVVRNVWTHLF